MKKISPDLYKQVVRHCESIEEMQAVWWALHPPQSTKAEPIVPVTELRRGLGRWPAAQPLSEDTP